MEEAVDNLEKQMQKADEKLDNLAVKVGNVEKEIFTEDGEDVEVFQLLKSVGEVKNDYQNLRKEISEVQDLQRQLNNSLQVQLKAMQSKFDFLKEKILVNVPKKSVGLPPIPSIITTDASPVKSLQEDE